MPSYTSITLAQATNGVIGTLNANTVSIGTTNTAFLRVDGIPRSGTYLDDLALVIDTSLASQPITIAVDVVWNESAPVALGVPNYKYRLVTTYTFSSTYTQTPTNFPGWINDAVKDQWRYHPRQDYSALIFRLRRSSASNTIFFYGGTGTFTSTETAEPRFTPSGMEYVDDYTRGVGKQLGVCARSGNAYPLAELVTDPVTNSKVHWRYVDPPAHRSGRPTRRL